MPLGRVFFQCRYCNKIFDAYDENHAKEIGKQHLLNEHFQDVYNWFINKYVIENRGKCPRHRSRLQPNDIDKQGYCKICGYPVLNWWVGLVVKSSMVRERP